jgi:hypothetical protein
LANSSIAGTLQHIMQAPQARPGTRGGKAEVKAGFRSGSANSGPFHMEMRRADYLYARLRQRGNHAVEKANQEER